MIYTTVGKNKHITIDEEINKEASAEEQYKLILDGRSREMTDYQWHKEHGINL